MSWNIIYTTLQSLENADMPLQNSNFLRLVTQTLKYLLLSCSDLRAVAKKDAI